MGRRVICVMGRVLDQEDGLGYYSANLLNQIFRMDMESDYVVLLRTPKHKDMFLSHANVKTEVLAAKRKLLWDQVVVPRAARKYGAKIIFNPKFSIPLFSSAAGIFVLHGSDWYINPKNYEWWDNLYIRVMMPLYCWKAKRLLSMSKIIVDDTVKYAYVNPEKVSVSYAAPGSHFQLDVDKQMLDVFREKYKLPDKYIFTVARAYHTGHGNQPAYPGGNVETLVASYQYYRKSGGTLPLVIAGKRIREYLLNNNIDMKKLENIFFTGFIPYTEINMAYNLAEFFVLATLYESFAHPLVESMACGCPVIAPTTGACPEISSGAALHVDPKDSRAISLAMKQLSDSSGLRDRMSSDGVKRASQFTWEFTAQKTLDAFSSIA